MKLTVLTENHAGGPFGAEHGLCYLIDTGEKKFLLDTGHSDLYLRNAEKMGIKLAEEIETIVLSHGHWDHGNGLRFMKDKKLICHKDVFIRRYRKGGDENIGLIMTKDELIQKFDIQLTVLYKEIFRNVYFLGEIPRKSDFESQTTPFMLESGKPDMVMDDSAVAIVSKKGLSVITGCSHAGIVNIVEHAKKITGIKELNLVMGGFHLKKQDQQTLRTVDYFAENTPVLLIPSHCTDLPALSLFHEKFNSPFLRTGDIIHF